MKKTIALILAIVMMMALVACGGDKPTSTPDASSTGDHNVADIGDINKDQQTPQVDETKAYKKELKLTVASSIDKIDPHQKTGAGPDTVYKMIYNQLVCYNWETKQLEPELAESWTTESATSYVFNLRKGVKFSNGEELTADDFVFTYTERPVAVGSPHANVWEGIEKIEVINDYSFRIKLSKPDADLLLKSYLAYWAVLNREACVKDPENGHLVGTGGWIVDSWSPKDHVTFVRNDSSWVWEESGMNPTEKVVFREMSEAAARAIALQNNEIAASASVSNSDLAALNADANVKTFTFNAETLNYLLFNMNSGKFAENAKLRQALAYALNYEDIIELMTDGMGMRALSMWGKNQYGLYEDYAEQYDNNIDKAKALLAEAGYPNGGFAFTFLTASNDLGALVKAQTEKAGFICNVEITDSAGKSAAVKDGSFDLMDYSISLQPYGNRFDFIADVADATNRAKYDNPDMDARFTKALGETDDAKRKELYKGIQIELHEDLPYVPLYYSIRNVAYNKNVSGIQWEPDTKADFTHIRWEE